MGQSLDPDPGSGSGMNNSDHISKSLETFFGVKILKFLDADPGWKKLGSGFRDLGWKKFGYRISNPDPPH
jgi:hypothetical protein